MNVVQAVSVAVFSVGLLATVSLVVLSAVRMRRAPDDRTARFTYGWLATLACSVGLGCCLGLVGALADQVALSPLAAAGIVAVNLLAQPVAVMFIVTGVSKLVHGLRGKVAVAWRLVPEKELGDLTSGEQRRLARYCIAQGVVVLPLGVALSFILAWPLIHWH